MWYVQSWNLLPAFYYFLFILSSGWHCNNTNGAILQSYFGFILSIGWASGQCHAELRYPILRVNHRITVLKKESNGPFDSCQICLLTMDTGIINALFSSMKLISKKLFLPFILDRPLCWNCGVCGILWREGAVEQGNVNGLLECSLHILFSRYQLCQWPYVPRWSFCTQWCGWCSIGA